MKGQSMENILYVDIFFFIASFMLIFHCSLTTNGENVIPFR